MARLLPKPDELNFNSTNLATAWRKWKQNMKLYLDAVMTSKTEKEKYSTFLFVIGERGREIFNTWTWLKKVDADGNPTDEDDSKLQELFKRFEDYCLPKRNLVVERRQFFQRNQHKDESYDAYVQRFQLSRFDRDSPDLSIVVPLSRFTSFMSRY